jgi:hypothetical protein
MRDVAQAPPAMECPPWEDEKAVKAWVIAAMEREEEVAKQDAATSGPRRWNEDWARWQERAFELAEKGDFDAFDPGRRVLAELGQHHIQTAANPDPCRRRKNSSAQSAAAKWPPLYYVHSPEDVAFAALVARVDRIRSLLGPGTA